MKAVVFCALGVLVAAERFRGRIEMPPFRLATDLLVYATVIFCMVRAIPVIWDGIKYVFDRSSGGS